ncbi:MAG: hypothetical protein PHT07_21425 [Paludibacter sp.]|nr:hypothetical protein [Paludibacter sp.]
MENITFGIHFDLLADSFTKQIWAQKLKYDPKTVIEFEKDFYAILRLKIRNILPDHLAMKAQDKLFKKIQSHVLKSNKLQLVKPEK